jgi:tetratricopeptide (TPR) repeat protein
MDPERYERLCHLFDQAQPLASAQRAAFLDEACAGDPTLRAEVDSLLAHDRQARGEGLFQGPCPVNARALLPADEPGTVPAAPPAPGPDDALIGRKVGPYVIAQRVGRGGMGSVYRALREDAYRQQVALKVIRPGLDSEEMLRRFQTERQVLADLQHPHIARLLDGGTTEDGRPYFVMEYIDGESLDRYCDRCQLGTRERVQLLRVVCTAVQYAHERGVLHRDLKPGNVLVTAAGTPLVTDFGLAKRLEGGPGGAAASVPTPSGAVLGTPSYMAPEQAAGRPAAVGAATDVYALGAVLYELLTGRPPFRGDTPLETVLQVLEEEPVPPGRLHPKLARDLETVCLKCLRKEAAQRYASVQALADDLGRFLAGEPIQARPVGRVERLWRWCRRNRLAAALAATLCAVVLGSTVALAALWLQARAAAATEGEAKERAQQRLAQVEKGVEVLASVFRDLDPRDQANEGKQLRVLLGERLEKAVWQLEGEAVGEPLAVARLQDLVGNSLRELGHLVQAQGVLQKARGTRQELLGADHPDTLSTMNNLARVYKARGRYEDAETLYQRVLQARRRTLAADHSQTLTTMNDLGALYMARGRYEEAEKLYRQVLEGYRRTLGADHPQTLTGMNNLALVYHARGRYNEAEPLYQQVLEALRGTMGAHHPYTLTTTNNLARLYQAGSRYDEAEKLYLQVLGTVRGRLGADHPLTLTTMSNLGVLYKERRRYNEAEPLYKEVLQARRRKLGADHPDTLTSMNNLAVLYKARGGYDEAEKLYLQVLDARRGTLGADHPDTLGSMNNLAQLYLARGRYDEAQKLYLEALEGYHRALGADHPHTLTITNNLARLYLERGWYDKAAPLFQQVLKARRQKLGPDDPTTLHSMYELAGLHQARAQFPEAEALLDEAIAGARKRLDLRHPWTQLFIGQWSEVQAKLGKPQRAEPLLRELASFVRDKAGADSPQHAAQLELLATNLLEQRNYREAEGVAQKCLTIRTNKQPKEWATFQTQVLLGASLLGQGKYADAEKFLLQGYRGMKERAKTIPAPSKERVGQALERLVQLYDAWGNPDEAARWRKELEAALAPRAEAKNP